MADSDSIDELRERARQFDIADWEFATADELESALADLDVNQQEASDDAHHAASALRVVGIAEFLDLALPPRVDLLSPWLPQQGLAMVFARRGTGKTFFTLELAWTIASGSTFLGWRAPKAEGVLYIDGEMPAVALQERLARMAVSRDQTPSALDIITPDLQAAGMPDLSTIEGQELVDQYVRADHKLLILDNLSSLCRSGKENEAESWLQVQTWALRHRARGRSVLFIHHSGKGGQQRGTSRREDVLDTVIQLRNPPNYAMTEGARFEVVFEKARGLHGADVETFEAQLGEDAEGRPAWTIRKANTEEQIIAMKRDGMKPDAIAAELNVSRSTVYRKLRVVKEEGKLPENVVPIGRNDNKQPKE